MLLLAQAADSVVSGFLAWGPPGLIIVVLGFVIKHLYGQVTTIQKEKFDVFREGLGLAAEVNKLFQEIINLLKRGNGDGK